MAADEEQELHDRPLWTAECSFRGSQYRYLGHQSGVVGYVKVKLLSAKNLSRQDYSLLSLGVGGRLGLGSGPEISPYMCFSVGSRSHSTSAVRGSCNPSWKKESFSVPLRKGDFEDGAPVILGVEGKETQTIVESVMPSTIKGDKSLGVGAVDVTNVVLGDADLVDTWISLSHGGSVHVLVGYEPHGIEPAKGDVVALEAFARNEGNLVLGKDDPLKVLDSAGNYLHCSYRMGGGRLGAVKVHRNSVFVIERLNFLDGIWSLAMKPSDAVLSTKYGNKAAKLARPYVSYAGELAKPAYYSGRLVVATVKTSVNATIQGAQAAAGAAVGAKSPTKL
ncbi:hypothetical protein TeGR_g7782 [Tetraparma gracilis]|nr:hypothetical protein TeGR_g7782 [Tetraparma gracilis]